jgi:predicted MPP superfamily phosphohydrolase
MMEISKYREKVLAVAGKMARKKIAIVFSVLAVALFSWTYVADWVDAYADKHDGELKIGFVTDIHAGSGKTKEKGSGTISPANFEANMESALKDMDKQDADYVVALGDNLDGRNHCDEYSDRLKAVTKGYDMKWVKGNHDKDACFGFLSKEKNYYFDSNGWRIIIFDNASWYPKSQRSLVKDKIGYIRPEAMTFLKDALNTDKKVLIAMHIPMWDDNGHNPFTLRADYVDFKKMLEEQGNVKYVLSGHYHDNNWKHEENGITYHILPSIEQVGEEGYHLVLKLE